MPSLQSCLDFSGMGLWGSFFSCCFFFFVLLKFGGKAFPKCEHSRNFHYKGRKTKEFIERGLCTRQILWDWVGGSEFFTINVLIFSNHQTNANPFPLLAALEFGKRGTRGSSSLNVLQDLALLQPQLSPTLEGEDDGFVHQLHNSEVIEITPAKGKESWVRSLRLWPIHEVLELTQFCWNSSQLPHFARICLCHIEKLEKTSSSPNSKAFGLSPICLWFEQTHRLCPRSWKRPLPSQSLGMSWYPKLFWHFFFLMINQRKLLMEKPLCPGTIKEGALGCHLPSGIFQWWKTRKRNELSLWVGANPHLPMEAASLCSIYQLLPGGEFSSLFLFFFPAWDFPGEQLVAALWCSWLKINAVCRGNLDFGSREGSVPSPCLQLVFPLGISHTPQVG